MLRWVVSILVHTPTTQFNIGTTELGLSLTDLFHFGHLIQFGLPLFLSD